MKPVNDVAFLQKKLVPSADLERGDIIIYKPLHSSDWQRAIFYRPIVNQLNQTVGALCLPLNTVGKKREIDSKDPVMEITSNEQILQAVANPSLQRAYVDIHLRTVVATPQMTTAPKTQMFYKIGTYHGLPFMSAVLEEVKKHFESGTLYKDGKPLKTFDTRLITAPAIAKRETKDIRVARAKAHMDMENDMAAARSTPIADKMPSTSSLSLRAAFDKKMIDGRTILVLVVHSIKTGVFPETLGAAYALVTKNARELHNLDNPLLEKDDVKNAIENIKTASRTFRPQ